jgi:hypothetical protein
MDKRAVGCTALNEQSSRSHMVFTLRLDGTNAQTGKTVAGGACAQKTCAHSHHAIASISTALQPVALSASNLARRSAGSAPELSRRRPPGPSDMRLSPSFSLSVVSLSVLLSVSLSLTHSPQFSTGVLNLIDLAGSERVKDSGASGVRMKEAQAINTSLSALSDVMSALGTKQQHVPFRNSKLTYLLQPCLGGDAKTLMFVNAAPTGQFSNETLCSLRFAAKVNACEISHQTKKKGPAPNA